MAHSLPTLRESCLMAADKGIEKGKRIAAHLLEASASDLEFANGRFTVAGTDRGLDLGEVAKAAFSPRRLPPDLEPGLYETATYRSQDRKSTSLNTSH